jgi:hypothetical protein
MRRNGDFYEDSVTLIVDESNGVLGTDEDHAIEESGQIEVKLNLRLPVSLFEPVQINVNMPEEFVTGRPVEAEPQCLTVPVIVNQRAGNVTITQELVDGDEYPGILGLLKRMLFR